MSGTAGLMQLVGLTRLLGWVEASVLRAQFTVLSGVAARVPVVEAVVPWGFSSAAGIVPSLFQLARDHP